VEVLRRGDEPLGCGERLKGPGMALVSRPPERHRSEGNVAKRSNSRRLARRVSAANQLSEAKPGCRVSFFFGYFLVGQATRK